MDTIRAISSLVSLWSIDIYAGWSIMDIFAIGALLFVTAAVLRFFLTKGRQI